MLDTKDEIAVGDINLLLYNVLIFIFFANVGFDIIELFNVIVFEVILFKLLIFIKEFDTRAFDARAVPAVILVKNGLFKSSLDEFEYKPAVILFPLTIRLELDNALISVIFLLESTTAALEAVAIPGVTFK